MVEQHEVQERLSQLLQKKRRLLQPGSSNHKLAKNSIPTWILNLSPHKQNSLGKNLCAHSTPGCQSGCLFTSGLARMPNVVKTRQLTTEVFLRYKREFLQLLKQELYGLHLEAEATGSKIAVRLNGTSDVDFLALIQRETGTDILSAYPGLILYDYTKSYGTWLKYKDSDYHLTFSRSESNWAECEQVLQQGGNVAVVFNGIIPDLYNGFKTFNGDSSDMRWLDPPRHIIALQFKKVPGVNPKINPFVVTV